MLTELEEQVRTFDPKIHECIMLKLEEAKEIIKEFKALESRLRIKESLTKNESSILS